MFSSLLKKILMKTTKSSFSRENVINYFLVEVFALWIVIHVLYLTGVGLCSGTLRTDCPGQWPRFCGRRVLSLCTARTTPTFSSTCAALSVEFYPSVEPLMKSSPTKMECGISRMRSEFVHVIHYLSLNDGELLRELNVITLLLG